MTEDSRRAAGAIVQMLYDDLEVDLRPSQIEDFITRRWDRLAPLAHRVHGVPDRTKDLAAPARVTTPEERAAAAVVKLRRLADGYTLNGSPFVALDLHDVANQLEGK